MKPLNPDLTEAQVLAGTLEALAVFGLSPERRNVGGFYNSRGQYVACNSPGTPDVDVVLTREFAVHAAGKLFRIETKRGGWRPEKARGAERVRFQKQLERLKEVNAAGGYGVWVNDPEVIVHILGRIKEGWRIQFYGQYPYLVSPEGL